MRATSSALRMPVSCLPFVRGGAVAAVVPLAAFSAGAGSVELGLAAALVDAKPEVWTIAPVSRASTKVLWTPAFWLRRVRRESVSEGFMGWSAVGRKGCRENGGAYDYLRHGGRRKWQAEGDAAIAVSGVAEWVSVSRRRAGAAGRRRTARAQERACGWAWRGRCGRLSLLAASLRKSQKSSSLRLHLRPSHAAASGLPLPHTTKEEATRQRLTEWVRAQRGRRKRRRISRSRS